jgi:hypothetical protein
VVATHFCWDVNCFNNPRIIHHNEPAHNWDNTKPYETLNTNERFNTLMEDFANIVIIVFFFSQKVCLKELKKGIYKDHARCQIPHKPSQNPISNHPLNMFLIPPIKWKESHFPWSEVP